MEEKIEPKKDINPIDICDFNIKAIHEMQMFNMFFIHFEIVHPKRNEGAVSCFFRVGVRGFYPLFQSPMVTQQISNDKA